MLAILTENILTPQWIYFTSEDEEEDTPDLINVISAPVFFSLNTHYEQIANKHRSLISDTLWLSKF